jgi:Caspase domain
VFPGHGVQANDVNYLIPVEEVEEDALLDYKALRVQHVLQRVEGRGCHLNLMLLDACRSKPSTMRRGSRDIGRGLAKMEARAGSVIAFACEAGDTAADGSGRNGVFTDKLLRHLGRPGVDVDFMLGDVASEVEKATSGKQKPFRNHNLQGARPCCLLAPEPAVAAEAKATIVPADLATWLKELALDAYGPQLVADHKIAFLRDVKFMEEKDLTDSGMGKIEAKRFVAAAAKLGATQRISGAVVEAAAVTGAAPPLTALEAAALDFSARFRYVPLPWARGAACRFDHSDVTNVVAAREVALEDLEEALGNACAALGVGRWATEALDETAAKALAARRVAALQKQLDERSAALRAVFFPARTHLKNYLATASADVERTSDAGHIMSLHETYAFQFKLDFVLDMVCSC